MGYNPFEIQNDEYEHLLEIERVGDEVELEKGSFSGDEDGEQIENESQGSGFLKKRFKTFVFFLFCAVFLLVARSAHLQITRGDYYKYLSENNRSRIETIHANRGVIYDANGVVLAENVPAFVVSVVPDDLPIDKQNIEKIFDFLSEITQIKRGELDALIWDEFAEIKDEPITVKRGVSYDDAMKLFVKLNEMPGVRLTFGSKRSYNTQAKTISHVLGYIGNVSSDEFKQLTGYARTDEIGKTGIEKVYEKMLRGQAGKKLIEIDAAGRENNVLSEQDAVNGTNLTLSIDIEFQKYLESIIAARFPKGRTSIIAMNPNNGEIISLVSNPSFDSNDFINGIDALKYAQLLADKNHPFFNRAISGEFPSGSVFKPIVAAAALESGIITEKTSFMSSGGIRVGQWFFPDWQSGGHGITNVRRAIAESINTFFYIVGGGYDDFEGLGVERISEFAKLFGLGKPLGIDLPSEASGFLPSKKWKEETKGEVWYVGDTYHLAIGQGDLLVTPLQIAVMTSVFANGGTLYKPHILKSATDSSGKTTTLSSSVLNEGMVSDEAIDIVRSGMRQTVTSGSAQSLQIVGESVAGKTGTAQAGGNALPHGWFTGFAPYEQPEITITVLTENSGGAQDAVPIAREALTWWFANRDKD